MNLANKITLFRVIMIPIYVVLMVMSVHVANVTGESSSNIYEILAGVVFILASLSDFIDGYIARKYDMVTDFGKFVDPLADKLLVMSAMVSLCGKGYLAAWVVIIILAREFIVTGLRTLAAQQGIVIAADMIGKWKTAIQMVGLVLFHFTGVIAGSSAILFLACLFIYIALILTIVSGVHYLYQYRELFMQAK